MALIFARVAGSEKLGLVPASLSSGFLLKSGGGILSSSPSSFLSCALSSRGGSVLSSSLISHGTRKDRLRSGVNCDHLLEPYLEEGSSLIVGGAPCLSRRLRDLNSFIACVLWREGTRGCLLSLIWGGLCAVRLITLSLRGTAAYHLFTGPDWPVREGTLFQETRDPVLLVSGKVGAHTRDNETDR
jgi:hypothetical protein